MPKENINCALVDDVRVVVGWDAGKDVQIGTTNAAAPFVGGDGKFPFRFLAGGETTGEYEMTGWFATLDREGINRLIRALRRARDAAYGADA